MYTNFISTNLYLIHVYIVNNITNIVYHITNILIHILHIGYHDVRQIEATMTAIPILLSLLRRVKDRGTHVIWISTTDFSKNNIIKDLNNMAKRYCTIYGMYICTVNISI